MTLGQGHFKYETLLLIRTTNFSMNCFIIFIGAFPQIIPLYYTIPPELASKAISEVYHSFPGYRKLIS